MVWYGTGAGASFCPKTMPKSTKMYKFEYKIKKFLPTFTPGRVHHSQNLPFNAKLCASLGVFGPASSVPKIICIDASDMK